MAMDQKTEGQYTGIIIMAGVMLTLMLVPYFEYIGYIPDYIQHLGMFNKLISSPNIYVIRVMYVVLILMFSYILTHVKLSKKITPKEQPKYRMYFAIISIPILIGPILHPIFHYYNLICFPFLIIMHAMFGTRGFSKISDGVEGEEPLKTTSKKPLKDMGLIFNTSKGDLHVHNVFQGIYVCGGAGAGKSASVIEPAIYQWALGNASMTIYDFKGNPATLGLMAYNSWLLPNKSKEIKPTFHVVSFNKESLDITARPNIFDPKYLTSTIDTQTVLLTFLCGLNPDWRQKRDFWGQSACAAALGIVERLRGDKELHQYCTLPHFIELATSNPIHLLTWIREDENVVNMIQTLLTNLDADVMQTLSNQMASLQAPLTPMFSPELYWVFGAEPENQTSIDINNPEHPMIMSISNDPTKKEGLSPAIASLLKAIQRVINQQGKHKTAYILDELPSIYLDGLAELPATARSNRVATLVGVQDESQLDTQYKTAAKEIIANLGSSFIGMTSNPDSAKKWSEFFGTYEVKSQSNSISDSNLSMSESLKEKKVLQAKDIAGQPTGHFSGKIADGAPAFYSAQFAEFKQSEHFPNWKTKIEIEPTDESLRNAKSQSIKEDYQTYLDELMDFNYLRIKQEVRNILEKYAV